MKASLPQIAVAAILYALTCSSAHAAATKSIPVGKCINLGNTFEPPAEAAWGGRPATTADIKNIARAGFNTIRIPVRWDTHAGSAPDYRIDEAFIARVETIVTLAQAEGLNVILDSHHFERIHKEPLKAKAQLAAMWRQIAARFAGHSASTLWFEIENEPHDKFDHNNLLEVLSPALAEIRKTNPDRPVIIGGERWSGIDSLATLPLPNDPHIIPTFHYYDPFDFTHQGASWVDSPPALGRVYGTAADTALLERDVKKVRDYIARTGLTPFMGETGAHTTVSLEQRVSYHAAVTQAFEPAGIGMCMWAYSNTFPFYDADAEQWLPGMLGAIGLKKEGAPMINVRHLVSPVAALSLATAAIAQQPTPELQALDDQLPGVLVNDPSQINLIVYGAGAKTKQIRDALIPGGGAALQIDVASVGITPYAIGGNAPLRTGITAGGDYTVGFYARVKSVDTPDGKGRLGIRFQQNAAPFPGFGDKVLLIEKEWSYYEVTAKADRDIPAGQAVIGFQLAGAKQQIEIGQIIVVEGAKSIQAVTKTISDEPEIPPQIASKGILLNDPKKRDWMIHGAGVKAEPTVTNVFGRFATKLTAPAATPQIYEAGASLNIGANIAADEPLLVAFLARSLSASTSDGNAQINLRMQKGTPPYDGFGDRQINLTPNWRLYQFRIQPGSSLTAETAQISIHLGAAAQQLEIGPVYVIQEMTAIK